MSAAQPTQCAPCLIWALSPGLLLLHAESDDSGTPRLLVAEIACLQHRPNVHITSSIWILSPGVAAGGV